MSRRKRFIPSKARVFHGGWDSTLATRPPEGLHYVSRLRYRVVAYDRPRACDDAVYWEAEAHRLWKESLDPTATRRPFGGSDDLLLTTRFFQEQMLYYALGLADHTALTKNMVSGETPDGKPRTSPLANLMKKNSMGDLVATATGSPTLGHVVDQAMRDVHFGGGVVALPEKYEVPQSGMGEILNGPLGQCLFATRASTITIKDGCFSILPEIMTEANCQRWIVMRAEALASKLRASFGRTDMTDPHAVSALLNGTRGTVIDATDRYVAGLAQKAADASTVQMGGGPLVLPPCLTRKESGRNPKKNFGNAQRLAYAIAIANLIRMTRSNKIVTMAVVNKALTAARTPEHQMEALDLAVDWKLDGSVKPIYCRSGGEKLQCPFLSDQSVCNGGDYSATPASVAIGLTLRASKGGPALIGYAPTGGAAAATSDGELVLDEMCSLALDEAMDRSASKQAGGKRKSSAGSNGLAKRRCQ
jgi:hypothetical protein